MKLKRLDQQIGDGDHIFNILRGLEEISKLRESLIVSLSIKYLSNLV